MKRIVFAAICALSLSGVVAYAAQKGGAEPTAAKNLQVLPKTIPMKELKALMKAQAKELGVQCDFCHDTDDFSKDTDMKKTGRWMMTLVGTINKQFQGKDMVNCGTCHRAGPHRHQPAITRAGPAWKYATLISAARRNRGLRNRGPGRSDPTFS